MSRQATTAAKQQHWRPTTARTAWPHAAAISSSELASQHPHMPCMHAPAAATRRLRVAAAASPADDVQPVPPAPLCTSDEPEDLRRDADCECDVIYCVSRPLSAASLMSASWNNAACTARSSWACRHALLLGWSGVTQGNLWGASGAIPGPDISSQQEGGGMKCLQDSRMLLHTRCQLAPGHE